MVVKATDCIEVYFPDGWTVGGSIDAVSWLRERGWKLWGIVDVGMMGLRLNRRSAALRVWIPENTMLDNGSNISDSS